jgi:uncharacterized protein involved in outer membrane biogenesis
MNAGFLQQHIEKKLSSLLGAQISFEKLNVSILSGSVEASGVTISSQNASLPPILTVARIRAEIAVARALKGEIAVKSLVIERPMIQFVRRDAQTNVPTRKAQTPPAVEEKSEKASWKLDVEKILILDGKATADLGERVLRADKLLAELKRVGDGYELTLLADDVSHVGSIRGNGKITGVADLAAICNAALSADVNVGDIGQIHFTTPRLGSRDEGEITFRGGISLAKLRSLLREAGWG